MANNVFDQTLDKEIHLSSNQIVSKAIEALLGYTDEEHFETFLTAFAGNFRPICSDRFASHVLQKMIEIAFLRSITEVGAAVSENKKQKTDDVPNEKQYNLIEQFAQEHRKKCSDFVLKISKFLLNNLEDFMYDLYANHVIRTCIYSLAGMYSAKTVQNKSTTVKSSTKDIITDVEYFEVPDEEWKAILQEFANRLELWPQFSEFPFNDLTSALLARLCFALKHIDKNLLKHFGKKILIQVIGENPNKLEDENEEIEKKSPEFPKAFQTDSSCHLLQLLLLISGPKLFKQFYSTLFFGRVAELALDRKANHAVQKLCDNIKDSGDFENVFDELSGKIEEIIKIGHTGVIFSLATACLRLQLKQGAFITAIQKALHVSPKEPADAIFICILKLKPYQIVLDDESQFIHLHGSLIVQAILKFNKPIVLVNSILAQQPYNLSQTFSTSNGSYCADAFLESKYIGEKSREKLIRHLEGYYLEMALTKFGSRIIEKLFEAALDGQKQKIVKELAEKSNQLNGSIFGRFIYNKLRIETFKLSPNSWKASFDKANKAEKLFKDIIEK